MSAFFSQYFLNPHAIAIKVLLPKYRRLLLPLALLVLLSQEQTQHIVLASLSDAFWQVTTFVATTLTIYHVFSDRIKALFTQETSRNNVVKEVSIASIMGMLPGCGGAIIVITQYVNGSMGFGSVVAVLTATMGDAAFLLLAAEPMTGLKVVLICLATGIISGLVTNGIHGRDFLRNLIAPTPTLKKDSLSAKIPSRIKIQASCWQWLMLPCAALALLMAGQIDVAELLAVSEHTLQLVGAGATLAFVCLWATTQEITNFESAVAEDQKTKKAKALQKVMLDTNFITSWVVLAFVGFELIMLLAHIDLSQVFEQYSTLVPLIAVVIGMIPGCGPQILTTSLYLAGAVPLSAQIGNAISNDGDALFPAIALSPRVAIVATFYSAIPALIVAYGYYMLFE